VWVAAIITAINPEAAKWLANSVGIGRGVDLLIYISILALFYLVFRIYMRLESMDQTLSKMVTHIAVSKPKKPGKEAP
jgi:small membrane protein